MWWGAVRTAGFADGGREGEDKEGGNMDEGRVDWIWTMMKAIICGPLLGKQTLITNVMIGKTNPRLHWYAVFQVPWIRMKKGSGGQERNY